MMKEKKLTKKWNITIFITLAIIMAGVIVLHKNPFADPQEELIKKILSCGVIGAICIIFVTGYEKITVLPAELWQNRHLIWKLAKNDFKTRFAGSYLGIVWAFVQPIVTVLVYWFVFQVGMRNGDINGKPFIVWYIPAYLVWTFFSEAFSASANSVREYSYLVKKVNFPIFSIPVVKVISALFIHIFFCIQTFLNIFLDLP